MFNKQLPKEERMYSLYFARLLAGLGAVLGCMTATALYAQQQPMDEGLSGPDTHEQGLQDRGHLLGDWKGDRERLLERGVSIDLQYLSDSLWNIRSSQKERLASWNRVRGTVNLDLSRLTETPGLTFHITGLWQAGGNLGAYLGVIANPSSMVSENTFRLDSYWIEKHWANERIVFRLGQFAGEDFYGTQHEGNSFLLEPLGYALGNLNSTFESFDPPSTPAAELRVLPYKHIYVKSMVFAADRFPFAHNPTGFVPQFRGAASNVSEIGWAPGQSASNVRAFDTIPQRRGYAGLYQFGSSFNPGKFQATGPAPIVSGNYLVYLMASQAVWRKDKSSSVGLDLTAATDFTPSNRSHVDRQTTVGVRYNEPLPLRQHNTISFGYVLSQLSHQFPAAPATAIPQPENALEINGLVQATRFITLQPAVQRFINVGGSARQATVFGFRSKVDF